MIEEDALKISGDKLPMEADDSDFLLEESLEKKRASVSISCKMSLPVTRSFNCRSNGQAVSRSLGHCP